MKKKELLDKFYHRQNLNQPEAENLMLLMTENQLSEIEITIVLMFYKTHSITLPELIGFRKILLEKSLKFNVSYDTIDVCGTGGDAKNSFNISTLTALVIAASGYKVVKHGNYGLSSICGSSNVLEYMGYHFTKNEKILNEQLSEFNICFLHAPLFHPALKNVASIRKTIASSSVFNLLGPLINPCNVTHHYIGVNDLNTMRIYQYLFQKTDSNYCLVHSIDGYDEISLTNLFKVVTSQKEQIIHPYEIDMPLNTQQSLLSGNTVKDSASIFMNVLRGKSSSHQTNAVMINAAYAIQLIQGKPLNDCIEEAKESLQSLKALHLFTNLTRLKYEYIN